MVLRTCIISVFDTMVSCAVARCKNSSAKSAKCKDGITFHRFPQDEQRRLLWQIAVNREAEWAATDSSAVCSDHFEPKAFFLTESGLRRLSAEAVPTINISPCESPQPTISEVKHIDITPTDSEEVIELKHKVHRLEVIAQSRMKRINAMWLANRQMERKLAKMKAVIKHMIQNKENNT